MTRATSGLAEAETARAAAEHPQTSQRGHFGLLRGRQQSIDRPFGFAVDVKDFALSCPWIAAVSESIVAVVLFVIAVASRSLDRCAT